MQALGEEVSELREKLQKTESEFQNYKREAKELEEFLEQESNKKQAEIRKLKEESILKEKNYKLTKTELASLQAEVAALKQRDLQDGQAQQNSAQITAQLNEENSKLKQQAQELRTHLEQLKTANAQLEVDKLKSKLQWQEKLKSVEESCQQLKLQVEAVREEKERTVRELTEKLSKVKVEDKKSEPQLERKNSSNKQISSQKEIDREREKYEGKLRRAEEETARAEKQLKQYKAKVQSLLQENEQLQYRLTNFNSSIGTIHPSPSLIKTSFNEEGQWDSRLSYSCLLLTKPHYISPFLEVYEDKNLIKIYKSTRTGCFEKSMGCYKHKFDHIAYDQEAVLEPILTRILDSQEDSHHTIVLYGVKRSNKKYIMSKILVRLKDFLADKLRNAQEEDMESIYMKRSVEEDKNYTQKGTDPRSILQTIDRVIALGQKSDKKGDKYTVMSPRKGQSKPKVRYFRVRINEFSLEVATSSHTNLNLRDKITHTSMLNYILFSKLPDILQSSISHKHLLLVLNPIVDLYEDCRTTLATTLCKHAPKEPKDDEEVPKEWKTSSPVREDQLNEFAKKRLQSYERQNEQTSLRVRKLEQESNYYKARFDQLQCRLKNLLNTHSGQNSYLKKSPVTLSYQKLLKFVHSVQSRNGQPNSNASMMRSNIYVDREESLDAL